MFGIEAEITESEPKYFEVFADNEAAVTLFLQASTQWRTSFGGFIGLDYNAVFEIMRLYDNMGKELFEDLQIMERAALAELNKKAK